MLLQRMYTYWCDLPDENQESRVRSVQFLQLVDHRNYLGESVAQKRLEVRVGYVGDRTWGFINITKILLALTLDKSMCQWLFLMTAHEPKKK